MKNWKKEIFAILDELKAALDHKANNIALLKGIIRDQRAEIKELRDRVMSVDYEKFRVYQEVRTAERKELPPDYYEELAGEIVDLPQGLQREEE